MDDYISREFMLKNLEADKMNNAEHCNPATVQIMERFIRYVKEFPAANVQPIEREKWKEILYDAVKELEYYETHGDLLDRHIWKYKAEALALIGEDLTNSK